MSMIFSTIKILWFLNQNKDKTTKKKANRKDVTKTKDTIGESFTKEWKLKLGINDKELEGKIKLWQERE